MSKKNLTAEAIMILRMMHVLVRVSAEPPSDAWHVIAYLAKTYKSKDLSNAMADIRTEYTKEADTQTQIPDEEIDMNFGWCIVRLDTGHLVEWHVTLDPRSKFSIVVKDHGFTECSMSDYKNLSGKGKSKLYGVRFTSIEGNLQELPQKRGVKYYQRQARLVNEKKWPADVWYALLMAEYHKEANTKTPI